MKAAAEHAQVEDGTCFVVVDPTGSQVEIFTVEVPHLQLAFFVEDFRRKGVATLAAAKLIDHYFNTRACEWLGMAVR